MRHTAVRLHLTVADMFHPCDCWPSLSLSLCLYLSLSISLSLYISLYLSLSLSLSLSLCVFCMSVLKKLYSVRGIEDMSVLKLCSVRSIVF